MKHWILKINLYLSLEKFQRYDPCQTKKFSETPTHSTEAIPSSWERKGSHCIEKSVNHKPAGRRRGSWSESRPSNTLFPSELMRRKVQLRQDPGNKDNPYEDPFTQTLNLNSTSKCHFSLQWQIDFKTKSFPT